MASDIAVQYLVFHYANPRYLGLGTFCADRPLRYLLLLISNLPFSAP
jgi:hypothetical protein